MTATVPMNGQLRSKAEIEAADEKPTPHPVNPNGIPEALKERRQWVCWRYHRVQNKGGAWKWTKVPVNPKSGANAKSDDRATWASFDEAMGLYHRRHLDGIGYMFAADDPYTGVDLDNSYRRDAGEILTWAQRDIDLLQTYTEFSPSNTGFKCYMRAKKPGDDCRKGHDYEIYDQDRFFAMTGVHLAGTPVTIENRQEELEALYHRLFGKPGKDTRSASPIANGQAPDNDSGNDDALIEIVKKNQRTGREFDALFGGDLSSVSDDASRGDWRLCRMLAYWTRRDRARIDRIFRRSGLMRPKWDEKRKQTTYGWWTIDRAIAKTHKVYEPPTGSAETDKVNLTDVGNAKRLIKAHGVDLRHCHPFQKWLVWNKAHWRIDDRATVTLWMKRTIADLARWAAAQIEKIAKQIEEGGPDEDKAELAKKLRQVQAVLNWCLKSEAAPRINAGVDMARSEPGVAILPDEMDRDPWLFNCENGTIDLRTGELREHRREDLITKLCCTEFDWKARAPLWCQIVETIFGKNENIVEYIQRVLGHCLTGDTSEQALWIWWGAGSNGKSLIINTILDVMGEDYAVKAPRDLFMARKSDSHPTGIARLHGRRLVVVTETGNTARLDETLAKELTGGDIVTARRMREDYWQFKPVFKPILVTNHKPEIRGTDDGIWRRCRLVPFTVRFWDPARGESGDPELEADKQLPEKLKAEYPGILTWLVRGCGAWLKEGLRTPDEVLAATKEYRADQDLIGQFLATWCITGAQDYRCRASELYTSYRAWLEANGEEPQSQNRFGAAMSERGFQRITNNGTWYVGITVSH